MKTKLSSAQYAALRKLEAEPWQTALHMFLPSTTLVALEKRGMVERRQCVPKITGWDNTDYQWRALVPPPKE